MLKEMSYHNPVMLHECVEALNLKEDGVYVDVTFGGGGHSREILKQLDGGRLIAFDQDADAELNRLEDDRFTLVGQNFRYLKNYLRLYKAIPVQGILADLGVSSHQFDEGERGFSIRFEGPLDMRMNQQSKLTAETVVNEYSEEQLLELFRLYGEIKNASRLVNEIVLTRTNSRLTRTEELVEVAERCVPQKIKNKYLAQVFQALRIEVNEELEVLKEMLEQAHEVLEPGGRLVVITYHSLEDRLVKNYIKKGKFSGEVEKDFYGNPQLKFKQVNRKPIVPSDEEIKMNNRARSAKLRIAEKL